MYDPVREKVGESSNLPISLKEQIWLGLESFLQQENYTKEIGEPDHLVDTWIDLSDLAMNEKRYLIALGCAQRANAYAVGAKRVIALRQIVYCLYEPKPDCKKILAVYREMLEEITEPEKIADRGNTIWHLATCLCCEKSNTSRDWDEAISLYRQALNMITKPEQETERAGILHRFADCLKNKPQPNWDEALELYQQALELLTKPKQVTERAKTLRDLAHCLQDKPQPDWDKAVEQ
jgi:tetratricopeptide (TPR) repeat protein